MGMVGTYNFIYYFMVFTMIDYASCLIKLTAEIKDFRKCMLKDEFREALQTAEEISYLARWLENWTYEQIKSGK
jgi:hypothetical protein